MTGALRFWFAAMVILGLFATAALAHDWYPRECCSERDCEPVPYSAVTDEGGSWRVDFTSKRLGYVNITVDKKLERPSQDGGFHICIRPDGIVLCFFAPINT